MGRFRANLKLTLLTLGVFAWLVFGSLGHFLFKTTSGASLGDRRLQLSSGLASANDIYLLSFTTASNGPLGSIRVQFCSNDPIVKTSCTAPSGFDVSSATLASQSGPGGFSVDGSTTANELVLTRPVGPATAGGLSFTLNNVSNPSTPGSYYARVYTYASSDTSGPVSDDGGIAFLISNSFSVTAEVPPFLLFCTAVIIPANNCASGSGDYIDFGELSTSRASHGTSQMLVATNAQDGYNVRIDGTTLTSGNNVISPLSGADVSRPGTPQFGFNLRSNTTPSGGSDPTGPGNGVPLAAYDQANSYRFIPGDTLITYPKPDDVRIFTASYIANVPKTQAAGIYVSTLTYVALGTF